jgi:hypothetical protein
MLHTRGGVVLPVFDGDVPAGVVQGLQHDQNQLEEGSNEACLNTIRVNSHGVLRRPFQLRVEIHRSSHKNIWFDGIFRPGMFRDAWEILTARGPVHFAGDKIVFNSLGPYDDSGDFCAAPVPHKVPSALSRPNTPVQALSVFPPGNSAVA